MTGLKKGTAKITVSAKENKKLKKVFTVKVYENNFNTNLAPFKANGNWLINGEKLSVSNKSSNDFYMSEKVMNTDQYALETDIKYQNGIINIFFATDGMDPFKQAYSVQFGPSENIRLFYFAGDTIKEQSMGKTINDGKYHHVKIEKTSNSVSVYVDGKKYIDHTFETVRDYYNQNTHVGIGLWDGALEVKNFKCSDVKKVP